MAGLKLDISNVYSLVKQDTILGYKDLVQAQIDKLVEKTGAGNDFVGWLDLPSNIPEDQIMKLEEVAASLHEKVDIVVVIGIGGSYLGAKSIISALSHNFDKYLEKKKVIELKKKEED